MELFEMICAHADKAHLIIFGLLIISAFNLPISEDILLMSGGAISSTCYPGHLLQMSIWLYTGSVLAAWTAYGIGYLIGPALYRIRWFNWLITPSRIASLEAFYERFGIFTFLVGRFCPGGLRNALFLTSGISRFPFKHFVVRDSLAALISTQTFIWVGYLVGSNFKQLLEVFHTYEKVAVIIVVVTISIALFIVWWRFRDEKAHKEDAN